MFSVCGRWYFTVRVVSCWILEQVMCAGVWSERYLFRKGVTACNQIRRVVVLGLCVIPPFAFVPHLVARSPCVRRCCRTMITCEPLGYGGKLFSCCISGHVMVAGPGVDGGRFKQGVTARRFTVRLRCFVVRRGPLSRASTFSCTCRGRFAYPW